MQTVNRFFILAFIIISTAYMPACHSEEIVTARWETYQIRFNYSGFTTHYTCDGIHHKVKTLLVAAGARDDVRVESTCIGSFAKPERFHKLLVAFAMPVVADETDITEETFPAKWERVQLRRNRPRSLDSGDCELVEQFNRQILRKIGTKDIQDKSRCIPRQYNLGSPNLSMTTLIKQEDIQLESGQPQK